MAEHEAFGGNHLRDIIDAQRKGGAPGPGGVDLSDYRVLETGIDGVVWAEDGTKYGSHPRPYRGVPMPLGGAVEPL